MNHDDATLIWLNVLERAIEDLDPRYQGTTDSSSDWFISNLYEEGSFLWICSYLSKKDAKFSPPAIRAAHKETIYWEYTN